MKNFLNEVRKNSMLALVGFVALGVLLVVFPDIVSTVSGYILGGLGVGCGTVKIVGYFSKNEEKKVSAFGLVMGVVFAVAGVYVIANPTIIAEFLISVFGAVILIYGIVKLKSALNLKKSGLNKWQSELINAIISLLLGIVFVINPNLSHDVLMRFLGAGLIVIAISNLWTFINVTKEFKNLTQEIKKSEKKNSDEIEVEGKVVKEEKNND